MATPKTKKKSTGKATTSTPKRKLDLAPKSVPQVVLDKVEIDKLEGIVSDLRYLKRDYAAARLGIRKVQAELVVKQLEVEEIQNQAEDRTSYAQSIERQFNETVQRKQVAIHDICEKRGIAPQELEYDPATGVVVNLN